MPIGQVGRSRQLKSKQYLCQTTDNSSNLNRKDNNNFDQQTVKSSLEQLIQHPNGSSSSMMERNESQRNLKLHSLTSQNSQTVHNKDFLGCGNSANHPIMTKKNTLRAQELRVKQYFERENQNQHYQVTS